MPDITFSGPSGRLEGKYFAAENPNAPIALVMHPHPLHGGTMNNKVTYRMYEAFARCGFSVMRFNFRGVGNSQGEWDQGTGELSDAAAALDWLHNTCPNARGIWIAGFSFGAWITMQLLMRRPDVSNFIAVAPPVGLYDYAFFSPCPSSGLVCIGSDDEIVDVSKVEEVLKTTVRQKDVKLHYSKIPGADHFFTSDQEQLTETLCQYITSNCKKDSSSAA